MILNNRLTIFFSILVASLFLTGCVFFGSDQPAAVQLARSFLAEQLAVNEAEIKIISVEKADWSDSCFGLGGPTEICAAEINPGWRVMFEVDGREYEFRTNQTGSLIRSVQSLE